MTLHDEPRCMPNAGSFPCQSKATRVEIIENRIHFWHHDAHIITLANHSRKVFYLLWLYIYIYIYDIYIIYLTCHFGVELHDISHVETELLHRAHSLEAHAEPVQIPIHLQSSRWLVLWPEHPAEAEVGRHEDIFSGVCLKNIEKWPVPSGVRNDVMFHSWECFYTSPCFPPVIRWCYIEHPMMTSHTGRSRPGRGSEDGTTKTCFSRKAVRPGEGVKLHQLPAAMPLRVLSMFTRQLYKYVHNVPLQ